MSSLNTVQLESTASATRAQLPRVTRVALVGPDGVGKSTVIALVREWFEREFPEHELHVRQWRPSLLPDLGRFLGKPASTGKPVVPRRKAGRFHLLRVFYYYWDFLLGSWWKDWICTRPGALVIYDRCALDMQVDPIRFGLQSTLGTRFLARFTPKPTLVIFLEDDPERIWQRKREIQRHEMREQIESWRRLAKAGEVHAIVRVDAGPEEVAARVRQLVEQVLVGRASRPAPGLQTRPSNSEGSFAILPSQADPHFLVPLAPRAAARNALAIYNPQTWRGYVWHRAASLALRTGLGHRCFDTTAWPVDDFKRYLAGVTGCDDVVVSISLGTPGVHRKPVFQVMDGQGRIRAFAKTGCNDATNALVEREAEALLEGHAFSSAVVPAVIDARWWEGNYVLVMAASPDAGGRAAMGDQHGEFLAELYLTTTNRGAALWGRPPACGGRPVRPEAGRRPAAGQSPAPHLTEGFSTVRRTSTSGPAGSGDPAQAWRPAPQLQAARFPYYAHILESAAQRLAEIDEVPTGFGHGDFSPWNIRKAGDKLLVLDWEYWRDDMPAGWDLFQCFTAQALEVEKQSGAQTFQRLNGYTVERENVDRYFDAIGVSRDWIRPLQIAWLADTLSSNLERFGDRPSAIDRSNRDAWAVMLMLALRADGDTF